MRGRYHQRSGAAARARPEAIALDDRDRAEVALDARGGCDHAEHAAADDQDVRCAIEVSWQAWTQPAALLVGEEVEPHTPTDGHRACIINMNEAAGLR